MRSSGVVNTDDGRAEKQKRGGEALRDAQQQEATAAPGLKHRARVLWCKLEPAAWPSIAEAMEQMTLLESYPGWREGQKYPGFSFPFAFLSPTGAFLWMKKTWCHKSLQRTTSTHNFQGCAPPPRLLWHKVKWGKDEQWAQGTRIGTKSHWQIFIQNSSKERKKNSPEELVTKAKGNHMV